MSISSDFLFSNALPSLLALYSQGSSTIPDAGLRYLVASSSCSTFVRCIRKAERLSTLLKSRFSFTLCGVKGQSRYYCHLSLRTSQHSAPPTLNRWDVQRTRSKREQSNTIKLNSTELNSLSTLRRINWNEMNWTGLTFHFCSVPFSSVLLLCERFKACN